MESRKEALIEKLISHPDEFSPDEFEELFNILKVNSAELRQILMRLFDKNDTGIKNDSESDSKLLGFLNRQSKKRREKLFWKKIRSGNFSKIILAEGDSWFEYPLFIKEIIDHLMRHDNYAVYSLASGGDWISNILYEHEYIEMLSVLKPDVFLISGGGNDIVGNNRLAQLVRKRSELVPDPNWSLDEHGGKIAFANLCLNDEFRSLTHLFHLQYKLLFKSIYMNTDKFEKMKVITHGYDYAIPSSKRGTGIIKPIANSLIDNGKWLKTPLMLRGYSDPKEQKAILYGMIEIYNDTLIKAGSAYENVFHVDCRNIVGDNGWYNELHPVSKKFEIISKKFIHCIEDRSGTKKIY